MSLLSDARTELATLVGGVQYLPERINPPIIVLSAGDPYITTEDVQFTTHKMHIDITAIVGRGDSAIITDELDEMIVSTIQSLSGGWKLEQVEQPFTLEYNNATYLASKISVEKNI